MSGQVTRLIGSLRCYLADRYIGDAKFGRHGEQRAQAFPDTDPHPSPLTLFLLHHSRHGSVWQQVL